MPLSREDKNPLKADERNKYPPHLPRYASRDHLHDRNRELCLFDPADPGAQAYVRVTRRRNPDARAEAALQQLRKHRLLQQSAMEQREAASANELLELRSQGIRSLLAARSRGWDRSAPAGAPAPAPASSAERSRAARVDELEQQLRRMRATYQYTAYSNPPAPAPAPVRPQTADGRPQRPPLRGGWPVEQEEFRA